MYLQEYLLIILTNEVFLKIMTKMPSQCTTETWTMLSFLGSFLFFFSLFFSWPWRRRFLDATLHLVANLVADIGSLCISHLYLWSSFFEPSNYIDSQRNLQIYNSLHWYLWGLSLSLPAPHSLFPLSHWIYSRNELPNFIVPEKSFLCCPRIFSFYSTLSLSLLVARKRYGRFLW